jgi:hypothetical protein
VVHCLFSITKLVSARISPTGQAGSTPAEVRRRGEVVDTFIQNKLKILPPRPQTGGHPSFGRKRRGNFRATILF